MSIVIILSGAPKARSRRALRDDFLRVVRPKSSAQDLADLAQRYPGVYGVDKKRHQVIVSIGRVCELEEMRLYRGGVARRSKCRQAFHLVTLDALVDALERNRCAATRAGEAVHSDHDVVSALHGLLGRIGRLGDAPLHPAAFDG